MGRGRWREKGRDVGVRKCEQKGMGRSSGSGHVVSGEGDTRGLTWKAILGR